MNEHAHLKYFFGVFRCVCLLWVLIVATDVSAVQISQDNITIDGVVLDEKGEPIPFVTISVKGTTRGVISDMDGRFTLSVRPNEVLLVSFVGYKSQEITVTSKRSLKVILYEDTKVLEDVVIVGYGKQRKETVTGAIGSISTKDLTQTPVANISNALSGRIPGLIAVQRSGEPGKDAATLRVRGTATLNGADPLIIIDGIERGTMNEIDPNEVESVSVLKDASATAVYGVKGANGVVIITTKRGKQGKPVISASGNYGITQQTRKVKPLGAYDYAVFRNEAIRNDITPESDYSGWLINDDILWKLQHQQDYTPAELDEMRRKFGYSDAQIVQIQSQSIYYNDINWQDQLIDNSAAQQQYNVNISGGTDKVRYFASVGYLSQDGLYRDFDYGGANMNSYYERYNFRSNLDVDVFKNLQANITFGGNLNEGGSPDMDIKDLYQAFQTSVPWQSPHIMDGKLISGYMYDPFSGTQTGGGGSPLNNVINKGSNVTKGFSANLNIVLKHQMDYLLKGLSIKGTVAYDFSSARVTHYKKSVNTFSVDRDPENPVALIYNQTGFETPWEISEWGSAKSRKIYLEGSVNYERSFGRHDVSGLVLYNQSKEFLPWLEYNLPRSVMGVVGRITYAYAKRYLAEFNMGYNGSENFPNNKRFGFFPAFSLGWVLSEEKFFPANDYLTWVKIRTSYGEVGNDQFSGDRYLYLPSVFMYEKWTDFGSGGYYWGESNGGSSTHYQGSSEGRIGNPNVTWEVAKKLNIGIELNFFKNRLSFVGDYFQEKRDKILWKRGTVPSFVATELPPSNIAKVNNKGFELELGWKDHISDFNYWIKGNLAFSRNKIIYMDEAETKYPWMMQTGFSVNQYKGLYTEGFYNTNEDVFNRPYSSYNGNKNQKGDIVYVDIDGDGKLDEVDNVPVGFSNFPELTYGFSLGFTYKGFDVSALFNGASNYSIPIWYEAAWPFVQNKRLAQQWQYEGRWTEERYLAGENITYPRVSIYPESNANAIRSSFWTRSANFLRLKNVEIGYTIHNVGVLSKVGISNIRFYANGNNLLTWTGLIDGMDPETDGNAELSQHGQLYPQTRTFNFGFNVQF